MRDGSIDVYCECIEEDVGDNIMGVETSHGESSLNEEENCVIGGVDPLIDFEGLHYDEEFDREYMPQNETLCDSNDSDDEGESDRPISEYNDIDDDGVLTPSRTYEEDLFVDERMKKIVEERKKKRP